MKIIIFCILYLLIAGTTTFCMMYYDRMKWGSYDEDIAYFGCGLIWPILLPLLLGFWILSWFKKIFILLIELIMLRKEDD